jgi:hypothetical protein
MKLFIGVVVAGTLCGASEVSAQAGGGAPQQPMGFFITSVGKGDGGNLGGLAGADAIVRHSPRPSAPAAAPGMRI